MFWTLLIIAASVALDQWTKYLAVTHLQPIDTFPLIENILHLTYVENRGAAFGMLANHRWVFMLLSTASIVLLLFWLLKEKPKSRWITSAGAMIVGGGIGNMIDRVALGYVVDFIDVRAIDFYVFNVADSFVCVGCGMILVWTLYMELVAKKPAMDILLGIEPKKDGGNTAPAEKPEEKEPAGESSAEENVHES
ncbi:MAG: signal peptidase II [Clostridia bacterium]|nr:signal peptidase II [Clostridia bacterium]